MSTHINAANKNDIAESILLPGDPLRAKFIAENFLDSPKCYNEIRGMLGYTGTYRGVPVSVQGTGMGMPSMGIYSWELITEYGVQNLIRIGTAGSFHEDIKVRDIVVGMAASTDSNYIHAFDVPGNYAPCASFKLLSELEATSKQLDIPFKAGNIVSCDVFYELKEDWWKKVGCHERSGCRNGSCCSLHECRLQPGKRAGYDDHQRSLRDRGEGHWQRNVRTRSLI